MTLRQNVFMLWGLFAFGAGFLEVLDHGFSIRLVAIVFLAGWVAAARLFFEDDEAYMLGAAMLVSAGFVIGWTVA